MKYNIGAKVRIVNYGHHIWKRWGNSNSCEVVDVHPEIIGREGVIIRAEETQGKWQYSIEGVNEKSAWYNEDQLELI